MTSKTKNIALVLGFTSLVFVSYKLAISKTIETRLQAKKMMTEELLYKDSPRMLLTLNKKQQYYDSILSANRLDGTSLQNNLLKTINNYANNNDLKVIDFLEPHITNTNDLQIKTYQFTLEGSYNDILKLIHQLEQQTKFGEVINLHFEKKRNYRTRRYYLQAKVLLNSF